MNMKNDIINFRDNFPRWVFGRKCIFIFYEILRSR
jgi:hypothetical protein